MPGVRSLSHAALHPHYKRILEKAVERLHVTNQLQCPSLLQEPASTEDAVSTIHKDCSLTGHNKTRIFSLFFEPESFNFFDSKDIKHQMGIYFIEFIK